MGKPSWANSVSMLWLDVSIWAVPVGVLYLSIESGSAAINVMGAKVNLYHTTFSAYMARKKQGVSQIKYLNKKDWSAENFMSGQELSKYEHFFKLLNYEWKTIVLHKKTRVVKGLLKQLYTKGFVKEDKLAYYDVFIKK